MLAAHTKHESNRKVTKVFPPDRRVKYDAFSYAYTGMNTADIRIRPAAMART